MLDLALGKNPNRRLRVVMLIAMGMLLACAPLVCIRFCQVRHALATRVGVDPHFLHHDDAHAHSESHAHGGADRAPLDDMQQMVTAATELVPMMLAGLIFTAIVIGLPVPAFVPPHGLCVLPAIPPPKRTALTH